MRFIRVYMLRTIGQTVGNALKMSLNRASLCIPPLRFLYSYCNEKHVCVCGWMKRYYLSTQPSSVQSGRECVDIGANRIRGNSLPARTRRQFSAGAKAAIKLPAICHTISVSMLVSAAQLAGGYFRNK